MRFKILSFLSLLLLSQFTVAQVKTLPQITPPGPESQKNQHHGGRSETSGGFSYRSSGFRPNDAPGIAGEGWSLSAGGSISRTIKGLVDERSGETVRFSFQNNTDDWDYLNKVINKTIDTEHDITPGRPIVILSNKLNTERQFPGCF